MFWPRVIRLLLKRLVFFVSWMYVTSKQCVDLEVGGNSILWLNWRNVLYYTVLYYTGMYCSTAAYCTVLWSGPALLSLMSIENRCTFKKSNLSVNIHHGHTCIGSEKMFAHSFTSSVSLRNMSDFFPHFIFRSGIKSKGKLKGLHSVPSYKERCKILTSLVP